jgi:SAM-dependent methyltransferase
LDSENKDASNKAFEILKKIEMYEKSQAELFQKEPVRRTESPSPSISTAQQPETGAQDPYFHIAIYEINKIRKPTVIVDYGCGYGKLLTPMKNLGADVLDNIHYIGVDAKTACLLKSYWTAEKYGLFKNEPEFMTPEVFFKKDISVDFAVLMHTLHEIRLVDLVDSIYHITAKLPVGGQIFILEPGSFIEERNYVLWKDTDFKMIFSNHGFDVMPYPITTNRGNKLNAVNIIKVQNENFPKEIVAEKCLLMFEAKKKELFGMLNNNPTGSEKDKEIDLLYSYISRQIDEYKAILNK